VVHLLSPLLALIEKYVSVIAPCIFVS